MTELLFSYGTLQQPEVQRATFGRELTGHRDAIVGYELDYVTITDPHVLATSGTTATRSSCGPPIGPTHTSTGRCSPSTKPNWPPPTITRWTTIAGSRCRWGRARPRGYTCSPGDYPSRQVTVVVASWWTTTCPSTAISQ